jgi:hypothetical protein
MTQNPKAQGRVVARASITFPRGLFQTLKQVAKRKKASPAWIVPNAAESYVADLMGRGDGAHANTGGRG